MASTVNTGSTAKRQNLIPRLWHRFAIYSGLSVFFDAYTASSDLTVDILNANPADIDELTSKWLRQKLSELQFVAVTSALVASTVAASFAWKNAENAPTGTLACWYPSLLMAVAAITAALQQNNVLVRLSCASNGLSKMRGMMESRNNTAGAHEESSLQHYIWQMPVMFLNISIVLFVIGLLFLVFTQPLLTELNARAESLPIRITFSIAVAWVVGSHFTGWIGIIVKLRSLP